MAEILIMAVDKTHANPIKDERACYKQGMPVVVMPDGHAWGSSEGLPTFYKLKLPGVSVAQVSHFLVQMEAESGFEEDGTTPRMLVLSRRLWKVRISELPQGARNKLNQDGEITIGAGGDYTWAQFRNFLRRLDTEAVTPNSL